MTKTQTKPIKQQSMKTIKTLSLALFSTAILIPSHQASAFGFGLGGFNNFKPALHIPKPPAPKFHPPLVRAPKPVIRKPVIRKPVFHAPKPVIRKPVFHAPKPVIRKLVIRKPIFQAPKPVIRKPVIRKPVIHKPVIHKPVIHKPVIHKPVIHKPVIHKPVIHKPVIHKPVIHKQEIKLPKNKVKKPVIKEVIIEKPIIQEVIVEQPILKEIIIEKPIIQEVIIEKPVKHEIVVEEPNDKEKVHEIIDDNKLIKHSLAYWQDYFEYNCPSYYDLELIDLGWEFPVQNCDLARNILNFNNIYGDKVEDNIIYKLAANLLTAKLSVQLEGKYLCEEAENTKNSADDLMVEIYFQATETHEDEDTYVLEHAYDLNDIIKDYNNDILCSDDH